MAEPGGRGPVLIAIARASIEQGDADPMPSAWGHDWLRALGASFVTLRLDEDLRGCIGSIDARRPLGEDVARNARGAAYRDPRFPPVSADERPRLAIEVSVLSPREPFVVASEAEALARLRPGVDGVALEYGDASATFLPQVWESLPGPEEFLEQLRRKAGLPARFWHEDLRLSRYTVEKFAVNARDRDLVGEHHPGRWWRRLDDGRIQCDLCPRECRLHEGQRGACFVRARVGDAMVLTTYGRSSGFCVDPIEKKPLNHFLPGSAVLSFGTAGCNLACKFCQNWDISKSRDMDRLMDAATPVAIARAAPRLVVAASRSPTTTR